MEISKTVDPVQLLANQDGAARLFQWKGFDQWKFSEGIEPDNRKTRINQWSFVDFKKSWLAEDHLINLTGQNQDKS